MIRAMTRLRGCSFGRRRTRGRPAVRWFRVLLSLLVIMLLGIIASRGSPGAMAQEASPPVSPAALYTGDAVREDVPAGMVVQPHEEIAALVSGTMTQFKYVGYDVIAAHETDDLGILEYRFCATDLESGQSIIVRGPTSS